MSSLKLAAALSFSILVSTVPAMAATKGVKVPVIAVPHVTTVPQYTLQNLGTLTPGGSAQPLGINQSGDVFGTASISTANLSLPNHIFFWSPQAGMIDIQALPDNGPPFSDPGQGPRTAVAMNDHGKIIGESEVDVSSGYPFSPISHAFVWTPTSDDKSGTILDLGTLGATGAADGGTAAIAINNHDQVVGVTNSNNSDGHGFLWTPNGTDGVPSNPQMKDLGLLHPSLLDDTGRVTGLLNGIVTVYSGGVFTALGDPDGFDPNGQYTGYRMQLIRTDSQGDIYGNYSSPTQSYNPFVWIPDSLGAVTGHFIGGIHTDSAVPPPGALTDAQLPKGAQLFWSNESVFSFDAQNRTLTAVDLGGLVFDTIYFGNPAFPYFDTYPLAQNAAGDLVGECQLPTGSPAAFLEHAGLMYSLNLRVQGTNAGAYQLWSAIGINNLGQIAAIGQPAGMPGADLGAFLLTPTSPAIAGPPVIQVIQPQSPDEGDPDQIVDIAGTGFQVGAKVTYSSIGTSGAATLAATVYAETQIIAHIPSANLTAGTHMITVTNPDGRSGSGTYVVLPLQPVPVLTTVNPTSLATGSPDTAITFTGTGLYPQTQVGFGYSPQNDTVLTVLSASADHTQITVRLPASAMTQGTTLKFYAYTPGQRGSGGSSSPAPILTILNPAPTITSILPPSLIADTVASFTLTVNGTNFVPGTQIYWNGEYFTTTYVSSTQVIAGVSGYNLNYPGPDTIAPGLVPIQVVNSTPGGGTANTTQTIADGPYPVPTLAGISPGVIAPNTASYVFLSGSHFLHHSVIHIGSQAFPFATYGNYLSADRTQITLYLPSSAFPSAGVYPVTVVNPGPGGGITPAQYLTVQGAALRVSAATLTRDQITQEIVAQVTLADGPGADAAGVTLTQAALASMSSGGLPLTVGTLSANGAATVTLRFPAGAALPNASAILRISGQYAGGSFVSSRRVIVP